MNLSERNPYEVHAELLQRIGTLEVEVDRLRDALLHVIDGVGGPEAIGWNIECPSCIAARDLVRPKK